VVRRATRAHAAGFVYIREGEIRRGREVRGKSSRRKEEEVRHGTQEKVGERKMKRNMSA